MDEPLSFGAWLRRQRRARDLTQQQLGDLAGCAAATVKKLEADERRPSRELAARLADALAVPGAVRAAFLRAARLPHAVDELAAPAVAPAAAPRYNLPPQPTPFIGRQAELTVLGKLLAADQTRLLTISGPGGMGKTRLALALAAQPDTCALAPDGVVFVPLVGIQDASRLDAALALALGVQLTPPNQQQLTPRAQILNWLRAKTLLLILDNCELLLDELRALVGTILAAAPGVHVLATSRERLNLRGEQLFPLGGLSRDRADDAATLFISTATRLQPDLALDAGQRRQVQRICTLLDGMPLAIELAASWADTLTISQIAAEVAAHGLTLLENDLTDLPARHRSMRALMQAAWQQLSPADRPVAARFALFHGGWTRDAAEKITGATLAQLTTLVRKAIVQHHPAADRFTMHELLRQYAAEQLTAMADEAQSAADRHATYYLQNLATQAAALQGHGHLAALAELQREQLNISAAWTYAVERPLPALLAAASDALGYFYEWQGYLQEGERAFGAAARHAAQCAGEPGAAQLRLQAWHAVFCAFAGKLDAAYTVLEQVVASCEPDSAEQAFALWRLGQVVTHRGGDGVPHYQASLQICGALGLEWEASAVLADLGYSYHLQGTYAQAAQALAAGQAICERRGDERGLSQILDIASLVAVEAGTLEAAEQLARRSYELAQQLGYRSRAFASLNRLGQMLTHRGDYAEGVACLERSLAGYHEIGDLPLTAAAYSRLALALLHYGDGAAARRHAATGVALARPYGGWGLAQALLIFACAHDSVDPGAADAALDEGVALCRARRLDARLGELLAAQSGVAWMRGDKQRARTCAAEALRLAVDQHALMTLIMSFLICIEPLIDDGQAQLAAELYALDDDTFWHASRYIGPYRAHKLAALRAELSPAELDAALARGAARDPWALAADLLAYMAAAGWDCHANETSAGVGR